MTDGIDSPARPPEAEPSVTSPGPGAATASSDAGKAAEHPATRSASTRGTAAAATEPPRAAASGVSARVPSGRFRARSDSSDPAPEEDRARVRGTTPRLSQGREHIVATVDEIPPGSSKVVPIGRHGVGVYNVNGTFYAIANYCPHEGGPLCAGRTRGRTVVDESVPGDSVMVRDNEFIYCPWHQWGFELATGTTAVKPEWSIRTYPVRVVGDAVLVTA